MWPWVPSSSQWEVHDSLLELSLEDSWHSSFSFLHPFKHPASSVAEMMARALATILGHEVQGHTLRQPAVSWKEPEFSVLVDHMEQNCYSILDCHFQTPFFEVCVLLLVAASSWNWCRWHSASNMEQMHKSDGIQWHPRGWETKLFSTLKVLLAVLNNPIDVRQISKRKTTKFNTYKCMGIQHQWARDPTCLEGSETEREHEYRTFHAGDEVRCLAVFKESLQDGKKSRCLVNRTLLCHTDGWKSDYC